MRALFVFSLLLGVVACSEGSNKLTVSGLRPKVGPYIGGDPVTITGSGFQTPGPQGMKVYFGKKEAKRVVIVSDSELRVEPPAGEIDQVVDVEVVFDDARSGKLPKSYKYIDPVGPATPTP
jgi:hypothetical protein